MGAGAPGCALLAPGNRKETNAGLRSDVQIIILNELRHARGCVLQLSRVSVEQCGNEIGSIGHIWLRLRLSAEQRSEGVKYLHGLITIM